MQAPAVCRSRPSRGTPLPSLILLLASVFLPQSTFILIHEPDLTVAFPRQGAMPLPLQAVALLCAKKKGGTNGSTPCVSRAPLACCRAPAWMRSWYFNKIIKRYPCCQPTGRPLLRPGTSNGW